MNSNALTDTLQETLTLFDGVGAPLTTTEVADSLDLGRRSAYARLERLVDQGCLQTKKVGASARVWWRPLSDGPDLDAATEQDRAGHVPDWTSTAESLVDDVLDNAEVGVFVLDADFRVEWINEATERYFGIDRENVLGRDKRTLIREQIASVVDDSESFADTVLATYTDNTYTEQFECHVAPGESRGDRWLEHRSKPIQSGEYAGGRVELYLDITDRKRMERIRQAEREQFESLVDAVEEYAIFMLDADGRVQTWNPGAKRITGYSADDVAGEPFSLFYTESARNDGVPEQHLRDAADTGTVDTEGWCVRADGSRFWVNVTITAIRDEHGSLEGYATVTRDMTERREYEQRLREEKRIVESILDNQRDVVYAFDPDAHAVRWNDRFQEVTGYTAAEMESNGPEEFIADEAADRTAAAVERVLEDGDNLSIELPLETADGETIPYEFSASPIWDDGEVVGMTGVGRDVSDRKAKERQLQRQRDDLKAELDDVFDRIDDAVYGLTDDWEFTYLNDRAEELLGRPAEELLGRSVWEAFPNASTRSYRDHFEQAMATQEPVVFEEYSNSADAWIELTAYPSDSGLSVYFRDITTRKEQELELHERVRQQEVIAQLGRRALETADLDTLFDEAVDAIADMLDTAHCALLDLDGASLVPRVGCDWVADAGEDASVDIDPDSLAGYTLRSEEPVVVEDITTESRFEPHEMLLDQGVRSGICTVVGSPDDPWGLLGIHDTESRRYSDNDAFFVQTIANILATAIDRQDRERALERQREQLAALNNLNDVVREITDAVIKQSTREEIEATVCEYLADSESYCFAWTGDVDVTSQTMNLRTEAGVEGFYDDITITVDPEDERSEGPTGRAIRTGETQITNDIQADERHDPWRAHVEQYGVRSSAAIPIVHEDTVYGVLNLYADRPNAFAGQERAVISQLGEVVGHAIAATERKQALMSDKVVELQFQIQNVFEGIGADDIPGTITFDHAVPVSDGEYLIYGSATTDAVESVQALVEDVPHWESVTFRDGDDVRKFELRLSDSSVLSAVAAHGGSVESAVYEDGTYHLTIHTSPSAEVRRLIDAVEEVYPTVHLLKRRQIRRHDDGGPDIQELLSALTDRQRTVLETAYHAGFFDWPRDSTGEEVAESLGIASPTFYQHLRKAERKLVDQFVETSTAAFVSD